MEKTYVAPPIYKKMVYVLNEEKGQFMDTDRDISDLGVSIPLEKQRLFWKSIHLNCQKIGELQKLNKRLQTITLGSVVLMMIFVLLAIIGLFPVWNGKYS